MVRCCGFTSSENIWINLWIASPIKANSSIWKCSVNGKLIALHIYVPSSNYSHFFCCRCYIEHIFIRLRECVWNRNANVIMHFSGLSNYTKLHLNWWLRVVNVTCGAFSIDFDRTNEKVARCTFPTFAIRFVVYTANYALIQIITFHFCWIWMWVCMCLSVSVH